MRCRSAFTIVEVIVVTAIVAILAAIVFAVLGPSREKSRQTVCASQLRQWYSAFVLYASDHEGARWFPGLEPVTLIPAKGIADAMHPYIPNMEIWKCPDSTPTIKDKYLTTYTIRLLYFGEPVLGPGFKAEGPLASFERDLSSLGDKTPIMHCEVHDELFYQPRDGDVDPGLVKPYWIELLLNGSVRSGRVNGIRMKRFTRTE